MQRLSYDDWGRPRNPDTWQYSGIATATLRRGYTGHEHLNYFGFINMNGRMYGYSSGRMFSPDNYVQAPDFTQSYNRYSYCWNNPLKYTDPSGEFFATLFTAVVDFFDTAFLKGGLDPTSSSARDNAWKSFDPTADWSKTNHAFKIDMGLFQGSPKQILSRLTWELPQTILGNLASHGSNIGGDVESVDYYDGATVVRHHSEGWGGFTLGSYINGDNSIRADPTNALFQHEYGHYLQSQAHGWFYLGKDAIPSLLSKGDHNLHPVEQDANVRAFQYFNEHIPGYNGWDFIPGTGNPIVGYNKNLSYHDPSNQAALHNRLTLSWYDFALFPTTPLIHGFINSLILNGRY